MRVVIELAEITLGLNLTLDADPLIPDLRAAAISQFELLTGAWWNERTAVEIVMRYPLRRIYLPLQNTTAIVVEQREDAADAWVALVAEDDYEFLQASGQNSASVLELDVAPRFLRLTLTGGYSSSTVPADIKRALLLEIGFQLRRWQGGRIIADSDSRDGVTTDYLQQVSPGALALTASTSHPVFSDTAKRRRVFLA